MQKNIIKRYFSFLGLVIILPFFASCSKFSTRSQRDLISPNIKQSAGQIWDGDIDETWFDSNEGIYHISTAQEFAGIANLVNSGYTNFVNKTIVVDYDIHLNDVSNYLDWGSVTTPSNNWTPIGINGFSFNGVIDFSGHTVSGMYIGDNVINSNPGNQNIGLFGMVSMKSPDSPFYISNLNLFNSLIAVPNNNSFLKNVGSVVGKFVNGGIYGKLNGIVNTVSDCKIVSSISSVEYIGGLVGFNQTNVINSGFTGDMILNNSSAKVGGITGGGSFPSFVVNSYSTVNLTKSNLSTIKAGVISYQSLPIHCFYLKDSGYNKNHFAFGYARRIEIDDNFKPAGNGYFKDTISTVVVPAAKEYYNGQSGIYGDNTKGQELSYSNLLEALNSFSFNDFFTFNLNDDFKIKKWTYVEDINHDFPINQFEEMQ